MIERIKSWGKRRVDGQAQPTKFLDKIEKIGYRECAKELVKYLEGLK